MYNEIKETIIRMEYYQLIGKPANNTEKFYDHIPAYCISKKGTKNPCLKVIKVSKGAKMRNRHNQVPHLTQDTNGKVTNSQLDTTNESQEVSPFPADDHKVHINRCAQRHSKRKKEKSLNIHKISNALEWPVKYFTGGFKPVSQCANLTLNSDVDQDT